MYDDETIDNENDDQENFQIQSIENEKKYMCLYDFVSSLYKTTMNATDSKYINKAPPKIQYESNQKGRPRNQRFLFQEQHP